MPCQTYEFQGDDENNKSIINELWCNINRWGAQENHYDLLIPIVEEEERQHTFEQTYREKEREHHSAEYYQANYIGRRSK
eukprot:4229232-Heterocapsa_arctica.AAC.1